VFVLRPKTGQQDLLRGMLTKDPWKRLTVTEVLKHPWTTQITEPPSPPP
ncbi:unnamed protein product, partial [Hapterophycus canaliculatus]